MVIVGTNVIRTTIEKGAKMASLCTSPALKKQPTHTDSTPQTSELNMRTGGEEQINGRGKEGGR